MASWQMYCIYIEYKESIYKHMTYNEQQNVNYRSLIEGQNSLSFGWVGQIFQLLPDDEHVVLRTPLNSELTL